MQKLLCIESNICDECTCIFIVDTQYAYTIMPVKTSEISHALQGNLPFIFMKTSQAKG